MWPELFVFVAKSEDGPVDNAGMADSDGGRCFGMGADLNSGAPRYSPKPPTPIFSPRISATLF